MELYTKILCTIAVLLFAMLQSCYGEVKDQDQHVVPVSVPHDHGDQTYYATTAQISDPPNMVLFQQPPLNLLQDIAGDDSLMMFGTDLLNDTSGNKIERIKSDQPTEKGRLREIFRVWLNGGGVHPITWNTLIVVLERSGLVSLSDRVCQFVNESVLDIPGIKHNHLYPETAVVTLRKTYMEQPVIKQTLSSMKYFDVVLNEINGPSTNVDLAVLNFTRLSITGQPGAGKTTHMRYLAKKWAEYKALNYCEILFLIDLEELNGILKLSGKRIELKDLLLEVSHRDVNEIAASIINGRGNGACFLFDGYNELNKGDLIHKIFFENYLSLSHCIMTSRPYTFENRSIPKEILQLELVGLNYDNLELYLDDLFNDSKIPLKNAILKQWEDNPKLKEICTLPMHLNMIIQIFENGGEQKMQTKTQIYIEFLSLTVKHYKVHPNFVPYHFKQCIINGEVTDDCSQMCTAVQYLCNVAFNMTFRDTLAFPSSEFKIQENLKKLSFVSIAEDGLYDVRYTFSHPTFREFFAALHLIAMPPEDVHKFIELCDKKYSFAWTFYFGLFHDYKLQPPSVYIDQLKLFSKLHLHDYGYFDIFHNSSLCVDSPLLRLLKEVGYSKDTCIDLLTSAGVMNNSTLCVVQSTVDERFVAYMLNHIDICELEFQFRHYRPFSFTLKNEACSLAEDYLRLWRQVIIHDKQRRSRTAISSVTTWSGNAQYFESAVNISIKEFIEELDWMYVVKKESFLKTPILRIHYFKKFIVTVLVISEHTRDLIFSLHSHYWYHIQSLVKAGILYKDKALKISDIPCLAETMPNNPLLKILQDTRIVACTVCNNHYTQEMYFEILKILPNLKLLHFHFTIIQDDLSIMQRECLYSIEFYPFYVPAQNYLYPEGSIEALRNQYKHQSVIKQKSSRMHFLDVVLNEVNGLATNVDVSMLSFTRLLITGQPGAGKTTYMRHLAKKWAEYKAFECCCKILFLIDLEELNRDFKLSGKKINDLLLAVFGDVPDIEEIATTIATEHGNGACFLFDGYDKLNHAKGDLIDEIFFEDHLHLSRCVLTSRYTFEFVFILPKFKHLELVGFNCDNLEPYLDDLYSNSEMPLKNAILKQWEDNPKLKEICTLPMHLNMMIYMIEDNYTEQNIRTKTQMYFEFLSMTVRHYEEFFPNLDSNHLKECIINGKVADDRSQMCAAVQYLRSVAFNMTFNDILRFPILNPEIQENLKKLSFVSIETADTSGNLDHVRYMFSHLSFCEFFAALHLIAMPPEEIHEFIELDNTCMRKHSFTWTFYFGLLHDYKFQPTHAYIYQLKLYSKYHLYKYDNTLHHCSWYVDTHLLQLLKEVGYSKDTCIEALTSAGVMNNSTLYATQTSSETSFIAYMLNHIDICELNLVVYPYTTVFTLKNEACSLAEDYSRLLTQLMSHASGDRRRFWTAVSSVTAWSGYPQYLKSAVMVKFFEELDWAYAMKESFSEIPILHVCSFEEFMVTMLVINESTHNLVSLYSSKYLWYRVQLFINHGLMGYNDHDKRSSPFYPPDFIAEYRPLKFLQDTRIVYYDVSDLDYAQEMYLELQKILPNLRQLHLHYTIVQGDLFRKIYDKVELVSKKPLI